ncbi:MAG: urease accessory protein UreD [Gammaproteobacteria bacterium]|nr:urease accessory protein UreD [Gammaproteobacteria bacterium]
MSVGWEAKIALVFGVCGGRTTLVRRYGRGPLAVQRPFRPGDGVCHLYLLHPPGGVAGGDSLDVHVHARGGTAALVTTPAAAKVYRTLGASSRMRQTLVVDEGASLEWLPQETILFGGSACRVHTDVQLAKGARFAGWEVFALGREHFGDHYTQGSFRQRTQLHIDGTLCVRELQDFAPGDPALVERWGLASRRAFGTLYAAPADEDVLARARHALGEVPDCVDAGATVLDGVLAVRAVGSAGSDVRTALARAWSGLRPLVIGAQPMHPRIWAT